MFQDSVLSRHKFLSCNFACVKIRFRHVTNCCHVILRVFRFGFVTCISLSCDFACVEIRFCHVTNCCHVILRVLRFACVM